jgi:hypothetical protein
VKADDNLSCGAGGTSLMFFGRDATCVDSLVGACWNTGFQDSSTDRNIPSDQGIYCRFCAS